MAPLEPWPIHLSDEVLDDLRGRLRRARLAPDFENDDWEYGTNGEYLADLVRYWADEFDWRAQETAMNAYPNHRVEIQGLPIHFLHAPRKGPSPMPLVLTHGWPWTFWEFRQLLGPLSDPAAHGGDPADAFDVIVPSLPGFGFSTPLSRGGVGVYDVPDLWVELMRDRLGHERFAAHGGDYGAQVTAQLGHKYPEHLIGLHFSPRPYRLEIWNVERPWAGLIAGSGGLPEDPDLRAATIAYERKRVGHVVANILDPQTFSHAFNDSPAGLASWYVSRRRGFGDTGGDIESVFPRDDLLTNFTIYWATQSVSTAARFYLENWKQGWTPSHDGKQVDVPTAVTLLRADLPPGLSMDWMYDAFDIRFVNELDRGGHYAPAERPEAIIEDIRKHFRTLR